MLLAPPKCMEPQTFLGLLLVVTTTRSTHEHEGVCYGCSLRLDKAP